MTRADLALDILQQALLVALQLSLPILLVMLLVGIAVSLIQALTHLQDPTLTSDFSGDLGGRFYRNPGQKDFPDRSWRYRIKGAAEGKNHQAMLLLMPLLLGWATNFTREMIQASATALGGG